MRFAGTDRRWVWRALRRDFYTRVEGSMGEDELDPETRQLVDWAILHTVCQLHVDDPDAPRVEFE